MQDVNSEKDKIHIAHVVYSFATGGLENGVVNLINRLPSDEYHHSIICITDHDVEFFQRITNDNVDIFDLNKPSGKNPWWLVKCWQLLRSIRPDICHSRNLNALEAQLPAWLAGVKCRIHGEHGWDVSDLGGSNVKYQNIRKLFKPFVQQYIGLSSESIDYLIHKIGVATTKVNHICNGVDVDKFTQNVEAANLPESFLGNDKVIFGTVGRLADVKNQDYLLTAFITLWRNNPQFQHKMRLIIVGEGGLRGRLTQMINDEQLDDVVWLAGLRKDIPQLMSAMSVFVLPSLAEGISNTLLEAMASGLPVIATRVGGNPDLIMPQHQQSHLVPVNQPEKLAEAMLHYLDSPEQLAHDSELARQHCLNHFSIATMVESYHQLYQKIINKETN